MSLVLRSRQRSVVPLLDPVVDALGVEHLAVDGPERAVAVLGQAERPDLGDLARGRRAPAPAAGGPAPGRSGAPCPRTRNCMIAAALEPVPCVVSVRGMVERRTSSSPQTPEVDDDVGTLGRPEQDVGALHARSGAGRCRCRPGRRADRRRARGRRPRSVEAFSRRSRYSAGSTLQVRRELAVDEDPLADRRVVRGGVGSGHPVVHVRAGERVGQLVVRRRGCGRSGAAGRRTRRAAGRARRSARVGDEEHPLEAAPVVAGRPAHPVVVVEAERRRQRACLRR